MKNDSLKGQHRINEQIRAKEVRIVGDDIGISGISDSSGFENGKNMEADLVEISPNAVPTLFVELLIILNSFIS